MTEEIHKNKVAAYLRGLCAAKYAKEDNVPCKIEEGLFLGSVGAAYNKEALQGLNITHILTVANSVESAYPNDFIYKKIEVLDTLDTNLEQYFIECIKFIDKAKRAGGGVLVHCFAGISRSATIVVAYLMKKHQISLSQALGLVRSKRPQVAPNLGFMTQLENFEKYLRVGKRIQGEEAPTTFNRESNRKLSVYVVILRAVANDGYFLIKTEEVESIIQLILYYYNI